MLLVVNIVFLLLVFRILLNSRILEKLMQSHWGLLVKLQHIFFLSVFLLLTIFTENYFLDMPELIWGVLVVFLFNVGIYYLVYFYLVPQFYLANKYPKFILYSLICFLVSSLFRILLEPAVFDVRFDENLSNTTFLFNVYILQGIVILVASFLGITKDKFLIEKDYEDLGEEKEKLHLDLLKSKLNPHFLFNILNNIYSGSIRSAENTSASILQLSKLLQYVIYDTNKTKISIAREFASIVSLIDLYQLRYNNQLNIRFDLRQEEALELIEIPPAIFLTIFENALKHSALGIEADSFITIRYTLGEREFLFEVENSVAEHKNLSDNLTDSGLGNTAILSLLEKYYPEKFTFRTGLRDDNSYQTSLQIEYLWQN